MLDPIGDFQRIRDNFLLYVGTAFGTQFPGVDAERRRLLGEPGVFAQEPWIEPLPRYESSHKLVDELGHAELPGLDDRAIEDFKALARCGLIGDYRLHRHQVEMLTRALEGNSCVVTAGTGSGKTESFLLPLFACLAKESRDWSSPRHRAEHQDDWWRDDDWRAQCMPKVNGRRQTRRSLRVGQRLDETRPAAMRALILYPMNALVEDQMSRLRRALDSDEARSWLQEHRPGNRIYIGRYNGETPVPGHEFTATDRPDSDRILGLARELRKAERAADIAQAHAIAQGTPEVRSFFPRLDGAEMRCRWDMQDSPPDILISNYSMLSIMLMRDADAPIFEKTRQWLEQEGSIFHLIIDELHLYRGTAGTEVAYLLRLLLKRLGLSPSSEKVRILASSASLEPDDEKSLRYLSEFFGSTWTSANVIPGYPEPAPDPPSHALRPFESLRDLARATVEGAPAEDGLLCAVASDFGVTESQDPQEAVATALNGQAEELTARLLSACTEEGAIRAVSFSTFARRLFGSSTDSEAALEAGRGLLIARGLCDTPAVRSALPSFRVHLFFRNIEGLWACASPNCGVSAPEQSPDRPCGSLTTDPSILCSHSHRILELLYCEQCGAIFLAGSRLTTGPGSWELLRTDPDVEGLPDRQAARLVEKRTYDRYAVFWPRGNKAIAQDARTWSIRVSDSLVACRWLVSTEVVYEFQSPEVLR